MQIDGWKYYNHAMIPDVPPDEEADLTPIMNGEIWKYRKKNQRPLFVRWTSDFDCDDKRQWWYVIKDTPFDMDALKAKRRYEIKKGNKYFDIRVINSDEYAEKIFQVYQAALAGYPEKNRQKVNQVSFIDDVRRKWKEETVYGAFEKVSGVLCGYAVISIYEKYADFKVLKANPEFEKKAVNAAIINKIMEDFSSKLRNGFSITDGERSISHETLFQEYLEKYFQFRKAYCKLNIKYRFDIGIIVKILYPIRKYLKYYDKNSLVHNIIAVLYMEELRRNSQKKERGM